MRHAISGYQMPPGRTTRLAPGPACFGPPRISAKRARVARLPWEVIRWLSSPPWPYTRKDMQSFVREQAATDSEECGDAFRDHAGAQTPIGIIGVRMRPASHLQRADGPISATGSAGVIGAMAT